MPFKSRRTVHTLLRELRTANDASQVTDPIDSALLEAICKQLNRLGIKRLETVRYDHYVTITAVSNGTNLVTASLTSSETANSTADLGARLLHMLQFRGSPTRTTREATCEPLSPSTTTDSSREP